MPMPEHDVDCGATDGLSLLLGPRRAEIMRLFWSRGSLTVREVHALLAEHGLAYTTVMTICSHLCERGLLERRRAESGELGRHGLSYVYTPLLDEAAEQRAADAEWRLAEQYPLRRPGGGRNAAPIRDLRDPSGVCRVCGCPVPVAPTARTDGLRVCTAEACRQEARRRDNVAKQRR